MATDVVTVWNLALSAAGSRATVSSEDEVSREANLCRLWYNPVKDNVLKTASWPSTKRYSRLAVLAERDSSADWVNTDPSPGYKFAYAIPAGILAPRYLTTYARFELEMLGDVLAIMTNEEQAVLHYSAKQDDVTRWDAGLDMAMTYSLASHMCYGLNAKSGLAARLDEKAFSFVVSAQTDIANEADDYSDKLAPWHSSRGFTDVPVATQFFYPYEALNAAGT